MTEPSSQPIFLVVDEDLSAVQALVGDLERRFRADYRVVGETSAAAALERLAELGAAGEQVALIICYESMRAMPGSEFLARSRTVHPGAKRILLIDHGDQRMLEVIARGMALGHIEYYLTKPLAAPPAPAVPGDRRGAGRLDAGQLAGLGAGPDRRRSLASGLA